MTEQFGVNSTTKAYEARQSSNVSQQQLTVIINGVTFSVKTSNDGEGGSNPFSGKTPDQQKIILANLLFGDSNPNATKLLNDLGDRLAKAGIKTADVNVDKEGKTAIVSNLSKGEDQKVYSGLSQFLVNSFDPKNEASNRIIMEIFQIALESRSEVVKMIIEAMEKNHQMWMEMLKLMAEKADEKKQEAKGLLKALMAKIATGDESGAEGISALLEGLGVSITLCQRDSLEQAVTNMKNNINNDIYSALNEKSNIARVLAEYKPQLALLGLGAEDIAILKGAIVENDLDKARNVFDSTGNGEVFTKVGDSFARWNIGLA